jgi:hypothetical protein
MIVQMNKCSNKKQNLLIYAAKNNKTNPYSDWKAGPYLRFTVRFFLGSSHQKKEPENP